MPKGFNNDVELQVAKALLYKTCKQNHWFLKMTYDEKTHSVIFKILKE